LDRRSSLEKEELVRLADTKLTRPSAWFTWHSYVLKPGMRVLDLACGRGRHAIGAAAKGCYVTAVDNDPSRFKEAQEYCASKNLNVDWVTADLTDWTIEPRAYDMVMVFNYLDRKRVADFKEAVKPGKFLMMETFLVSQREQGWGPTSDDHLLQPAEMLRLIEPFDLILAREVIEMVDGHPMSAASAFARRPEEG
jgi:2-polyprenyl-3-methyl-5-hydroxy-6-metoxy-1,4-benzoquinol methylase